MLDKVIVDKNARIGDGVRLMNERGIENADGDGYYIRGGIIIVPQGRRREAGDGGLAVSAASVTMKTEEHEAFGWQDSDPPSSSCLHFTFTASCT